MKMQRQNAGPERSRKTKFMTCLRTLVAGFALGLLAPALCWAQAALETPAANSLQSGIGLIRGWRCDPALIEVEIDGLLTLTAAYGTTRGDTVGVCGDSDNGWGLTWNWNLLGDGEHTVRALADGVEFANATFTVTTLGVPYLENASGSGVIETFPGLGENVELVWEQSTQNFMIAATNVFVPEDSTECEQPDPEPDPVMEGCAPDAVEVGPTCVDTYEASAWYIAPENTELIEKVQRGTVTLEELTTAGAQQLGTGEDDYDQYCPDTANGCLEVYAVSVKGVVPFRYLTWFQAAAVCRNAGKRLLRNDEWQMAAFGTPDPENPEESPCVVYDPPLGPTGTEGCVSDVGAFDMVGNVQEWVADWMQGSGQIDEDQDGHLDWTPSSSDTAGPNYGEDSMFGVNPAFEQGDGQNFPAALVRGGAGGFGVLAGNFALQATIAPSRSIDHLGFRCGR